jgi:hypothetical protein
VLPDGWQHVKSGAAALADAPKPEISSFSAGYRGNGLGMLMDRGQIGLGGLS